MRKLFDLVSLFLIINPKPDNRVIISRIMENTPTINPRMLDEIEHVARDTHWYDYQLCEIPCDH